MNLPQAPFSDDTERALIGALLTDENHMVHIASFLRPHMMYSLKARAIYTAMYRLHEARQPFDTITIMQTLRTFDEGRAAHVQPFDIMQMMADAPTSAHAEVYARLIERLYVRRTLMKTGSEIVALATDENKSTEDVISEAERSFAVVRDYAFSEGETMADANDRALAEVTAAMNAPDHVSGMRSGLLELDKITTGWQDDDLIILAGRPGMGKTSAMLKFALTAMDDEKRVAIFSMEMNRSILLKRLYALISGVPVSLMRQGTLTPAQYGGVMAASNNIHAHIAQHRLHIDDTAVITPEYIRRQTMGLHHRHKLDLLVVDHLGLMSAGNRKTTGRTEEVTIISNSLKALARELYIPIIALSQLNREVERRQDKRPMISDLRDSGSIEQDADKVIFLYRDAVYNEVTNDPNGAELIVAKHRNGATGTARAYWNGPLMRLEDARVRRVSLA